MGARIPATAFANGTSFTRAERSPTPRKSRMGRSHRVATRERPARRRSARTRAASRPRRKSSKKRIGPGSTRSSSINQNCVGTNRTRARKAIRGWKKSQDAAAQPNNAHATIPTRGCTVVMTTSDPASSPATRKRVASRYVAPPPRRTDIPGCFSRKVPPCPPAIARCEGNTISGDLSPRAARFRRPTPDGPSRQTQAQKADPGRPDQNPPTRAVTRGPTLLFPIGLAAFGPT